MLNDEAAPSCVPPTSGLSTQRASGARASSVGGHGFANRINTAGRAHATCRRRRPRMRWARPAEGNADSAKTLAATPPWKTMRGATLTLRWADAVPLWNRTRPKKYSPRGWQRRRRDTERMLDHICQSRWPLGRRSEVTPTSLGRCSPEHVCVYDFPREAMR